jgi:hypothetical protein
MAQSNAPDGDNSAPNAPTYNSNLPRGLVAPHQSMGLSFNEGLFE